MKKIIILLLITLISLNPLLSINCYAIDSVPDGYTQVNSREKLVESFLAYCKSRDSEITGSILGSSLTYTYNFLVKASQAIGISLTDLQAQLYYLQDTNSGLKWYLTSEGVTFFNELFAYLISNEGLEVGDSADSVLFNGKMFTDYDGNTALVYSHKGNINYRGYLSEVINYGTAYKFTSQEMINLVGTSSANFSFNLNSSQSITHKFVYNYSSLSNYDQTKVNLDSSGGLPYIYLEHVGKKNDYASFKCYGNPAIIYNQKNNELCFGYVYQGYSNIINLNGNERFYFTEYLVIKNIGNDDLPNTVINFTTNNTVINNEYEGDTYITNEGDIYYPDESPIVPEAPEVPTYNPYPDGGGNTTPPTSEDPDTSGGGSLTFPDIDLDLPSINWSLGDLKDKFPFSIPFDLVAFYTVLNSEPVPPSIDRTIPLGFTDWHFQADFSQFENYAIIVRNVEYIGFIVALIFITIRFVKG